MVFSDLSVRVSANTADFSRGINSAQSDLSDFQTDALETSAAMQVLQDRADETEDELRSLSRAASSASRRLATMSGTALTAATSHRVLAFATITSLVPALVTLTAVATPLVATLGGLVAAAGALAGAFGVVVGTGLIAFNEEVRPLTEALKDLREELTPILVDFGRQFIPVIQAAINALPGFVQSILDAIGPLDAFVDALFTLGNLAKTVVPDVISRLADLARDALPVFMSAVQDMVDTVGPAFETIMDTTRDMLPLLSDLGAAFIDLIPELNDFGRTAANALIPGLTRLVEGLADVLEFVNSLDSSTQRLIATVSTLAPAVLGVATLLSRINPLLAVLTTVVGGLFAAWKANFGGIRDITADVIDRVEGRLIELRENVLVPLREELSGFSLDFSAAGLEDAPASIQNLANSLGGLGDELLTTGQTLFDFFSRVGTVVMTTLRENRPAIRRFANAVVNALAGVIDVLAGLVRSWRFIFTTVIAPITMRLVRLWSNRFGPVVSELAQTLNHLSRVLRDVGTVLGRFWSAHGDEITTGLTFLADIIGTTLVAAFDAFFTGLDVALNLIQGDFSEALGSLGDLFQRTGRRVIDFANRWNINETVDRTIAGIADSLRQGATAFIGFIANGLRPLTTAFRSAMSRLESIVRLGFGAIAVVGRLVFINFLDSMANLLQSLIALVAGDFERAGREANNAFTDPLDRTLAFIRRWNLVGILRGVLNNAINTVKTTWAGFENTITSALNGVIEFINKWTLERVIATVLSGALTVWQRLKTELPGILVGGLITALATLMRWGDRVFNFFVGLWNSVATLTRDALQNIINDLTGFINNFLSSVEEVANTVEELTGEKVIGSVGRVDAAQLGQPQTFERRRVEGRQEAAQAVAVELGINIQGDSQLAQIIRENANNVIEERERRVNRDAGRGGTIQ